ncbi:uncharacterized protein EV420DRAFT_1081539 [Desarmillaria tabescens]|uniref:Uncharacterized protein n=1 Tax=Armillaria tabescens TaxID=1929756 RepID=A0AA39JJ60_ARMTA|nr:uncharacterized protein EV420DRAFT_1081539 [Desarmillaria tabescens]KAK0442299.1 hypothetical protein EV420DRAFT_1081539 [Desarmillaria tabescens]
MVLQQDERDHDGATSHVKPTHSKSFQRLLDVRRQRLYQQRARRKRDIRRTFNKQTSCYLSVPALCYLALYDVVCAFLRCRGAALSLSTMGSLGMLLFEVYVFLLGFIMIRNRLRTFYTQTLVKGLPSHERQGTRKDIGKRGREQWIHIAVLGPFTRPAFLRVSPLHSIGDITHELRRRHLIPDLTHIRHQFIFPHARLSEIQSYEILKDLGVSDLSVLLLGMSLVGGSSKHRRDDIQGSDYDDIMLRCRCGQKYVTQAHLSRHEGKCTYLISRAKNLSKRGANIWGGKASEGRFEH